MGKDVVEFIDKCKYVFDRIDDDELDIYNTIYICSSNEFVAYINNRYSEIKMVEDAKEKS